MQPNFMRMRLKEYCKQIMKSQILHTMSQVEEVNIKTCFDVAVTVNVTYGAENYELLLERLNR